MVEEIQDLHSSAEIASSVGSVLALYSNCNSLALHRVIQCVQHITRTALPCLQDICARQCRSRANQSIKGIHHPNQKLFQWLLSAKCLRSIMTKTERELLPQVILTIDTHKPPQHTSCLYLQWQCLYMRTFFSAYNLYSLFDILLLFSVCSFFVL